MRRVAARSTPVRAGVKRVLARLPSPEGARGVTVLTYHRVGGASTDELDITPQTFGAHVAELRGHRVSHLDEALGALDRGDDSPRVVLTFDDGFADVYENAWPVLRRNRLPFTLYLATAYIGRRMTWPGQTARSRDAAALTWEQVREMVDSGLCTIGNHTNGHVRPELLTVVEVDRCSEAIVENLGIAPRHFAYPWGIRVAEAEAPLRARFRSSALGAVERNLPEGDRMRLARIPVRRTDPPEFFSARLTGTLLPQRAYEALVGAAKGVRAHG